MNLLKLVLVVGLVAGAWFGYRAMRREMALRAGRHRVEAMLINASSGDNQGALCQWARGELALDVDTMSSYVNGYESFSQRLRLVRGVRWQIDDAELLDDEETVLVSTEVDGTARDLLVTPTVPIEVDE